MSFNIIPISKKKYNFVSLMKSHIITNIATDSQINLYSLIDNLSNLWQFLLLRLEKYLFRTDSISYLSKFIIIL